jgi:hypothetical protein
MHKYNLHATKGCIKICIKNAIYEKYIKTGINFSTGIGLYLYP